MHNPYVYDDSIKQGEDKVIAWAGIVDGKILALVWLEKDIYINSNAYLDLLQNNLWPHVKNRATKNGYL